MGVVYKALDTKLDRTVALKFLPPHLSINKEEKKRFIHEAKAAAALDHPHICNIHEIGETDDGQIFIALGYYEGKTLNEKISGVGANGGSPLPLNNAIDVAIQIAEGLQEAHQNHIVHRDIKSANIIITDKGQVKILDFGLAKLRGVTKLTKEGTTLGTIAYMSPEQASGEKVDHRSDIWSLGVLLYEMITGQLPFKGEYEQAIMYAIMNEDPESITSLRSGIPLELDRIVNKTLNKNPHERYHNTGDLIVDLKNLQKQQSSKGIKHSRDLAPRNKPRAQKQWLPFVMAALIILIVAGYFILKQPRQSRESHIKKSSEQPSLMHSQWKNSIAVLPFSNISAEKEQEYFCDGMTEEIITKLTTINDLKVISRTSVMRFKNSEKTIKEIGRQLAVKNVLDGSVRKDKNRVRITAQLIRVADDSHLWAKNYDRKLEDVFTVQDEVAKAIANSLEVTLSPGVLDQFKSRETQNMLAYEYYLKGIFLMNSRYLNTLAEEDFRQAVKMLEKALELDPTYAKGYIGLVWAYTSHVMYTGNQEDLKEVLKLSKKLEQIAPDSTRGHFVLGMYYTLKKDFDRAFAHLKKAWTISSNDADLSYMIGFFYYRAGLYKKAIRFCDRSIEIDPLMPHSYVTPILCSIYLKEYRRAEYYIKKAAELHKEHPVLQLFICGFYLRTGQNERAEKILEKLRAVKQYTENIHRLQAILYALRGERNKVLELNHTSSQAFAILGLKDRAITIIEKDLESNKDSYRYLYIINLPFYDNLRDDPRFQKIVADAKEIYEERLKKYGDF